jgi:uncharacterized protein YqeY
MLKRQIEQDLKQALLSGDKDRALALRTLKSVILYAEVAEGSRDSGLEDEAIITLLAKEAKKRQESADLYIRGGAEDRAAKELAEKLIIEGYLPKQLSDDELGAIVDAAVADSGASDPSAMGKVIGLVKQKVAAQADGSRIAQMVKERLNKR